MPWTRKFPEPIKLKDGREIATLGQARELMLALPERHQSRPFWQYAAQLLIDAAGRGDRARVDDAAAADQPGIGGRRAALLTPGRSGATLGAAEGVQMGLLIVAEVSRVAQSNGFIK